LSVPLGLTLNRPVFRAGTNLKINRVESLLNRKPIKKSQDNFQRIAETLPTVVAVVSSTV